MPESIPFNFYTTLVAEVGSGKSPSERAKLRAIAEKVSADPLLQRQLSQKVYELMRADLQIQKERRFKY